MEEEFGSWIVVGRRQRRPNSSNENRGFGKAQRDVRHNSFQAGGNSFSAFGALREDGYNGSQTQTEGKQNRTGQKSDNPRISQRKTADMRISNSKGPLIRSVKEGGSSLRTAQVLGQMATEFAGISSEKLNFDGSKGKRPQTAYKPKTLNRPAATPSTSVPSSSSSQLCFSSSAHFAGTPVEINNTLRSEAKLSGLKSKPFAETLDSNADATPMEQEAVVNFISLPQQITEDNYLMQPAIEGLQHVSASIGPNQVSRFGQSTALMDQSTALLEQSTILEEQSTNHHEIDCVGDTSMVCDSELPPAV